MHRHVIAEHMLEIVRRYPSGLGWYGVEACCSISRAEFPEGLNVKDVLEDASETGMLTKRTVNGKEKYFAPGADISRCAS